MRGGGCRHHDRLAAGVVELGQLLARPALHHHGGHRLGDTADHLVESYGGERVQAVGREAQHAADTVGSLGVRLVHRCFDSCSLQVPSR